MRQDQTPEINEVTPGINETVLRTAVTEEQIQKLYETDPIIWAYIQMEIYDG